MKMKTEHFVLIRNTDCFLKLCSDIAGAWLNDAYLDEIWEEKENGDEVYTEDAQDRFNDILDIVEHILENNGITKE